MQRLLGVCFLLPLLTPAAASRADPPATTPIRRVIIIYQENRSFDHYFGTFPGVNGILTPQGAIKPEFVGLQKNSSGVPYNTTNNKMPSSGVIPAGIPNQPFTLRTYYPSTVQTSDLTHDFNPMRQQAGWTLAGPQLGPFAMDHWVSAGNTGPLVLGYFDGNDIPRYWTLASQWTLADNYFQAPWGPSQLNYQFLIAGRGMRTSNGKIDQVTGTGRPAQTHKNVGDLLNTAGVSWAWYVGPGDEDTSAFDGGPFAYFANAINDANYRAAHFRKYSRFLADVAGGTLPSVCFVQTFCYSEHAGSGSCYLPVYQCQDFVGDLIASLQASSAWADSAIFLTYDECGGWWDHVSPAQYVDVVDGAAYDGTTHIDGQFYPVLGNGPRVPLLVVSRFAKQGHIAHGQYDSCSITRFIEDNWNLGRCNQNTADLTRDAQVATLNSACDIFNFPGLLRGTPDLDASDLAAFVDLLLGLDADPAHICLADMNGDGAVTGGDIQPLLNMLLGF